MGVDVPESVGFEWGGDVRDGNQTSNNSNLRNNCTYVHTPLLTVGLH